MMPAQIRRDPFSQISMPGIAPAYVRWLSATCYPLCPPTTFWPDLTSAKHEPPTESRGPGAFARGQLRRCTHLCPSRSSAAERASSSTCRPAPDLRACARAFSPSTRRLVRGLPSQRKVFWYPLSRTMCREAEFLCSPTSGLGCQSKVEKGASGAALSAATLG